MKGTLTLAVVALAVTGCSSAPTGSANSQVTRAEADIALADRLIAKSAQASPAQREKLLDRAESLLQEVGARDLDAELQLIAVNNLGVLLLERDAPQKAAEVLGRLRGKVNPRSEGGPALFYNLGRALEEAGRPAEALPLYREVLAHERAFTDAADVALRTARSLPGDAAGLAQALALVRLLVDQRNAPAADEAFLQSLADERWAGLPGYQELLTELVRWLDLSGRDPAEFLERVRPVLIRQRPRLEARARDKADSLVGALDASYPLRVSQETPGVESRGWQGESAEAQLFSRFLRRVGDDHFTAGRPDLAAQRYAAAWNLEATYTEAALDLAAVLDREAPELDPSRRLQAALIDRVERDPERLDSDPESRQYLHAVLADSLLRQGRPGPPDDPHSAIGQYNRAFAAHDQLTLRNPGEEHVPDLQSGLAAALRVIGDQTAANHHSLLAAYGYLVRSEKEEACRALAEALRSSTFLTLTQQSWITTQCEQVECPGICQASLPTGDQETVPPLPHVPPEPRPWEVSRKEVLEAAPSAIYEIFFEFDSYGLDSKEETQKLDSIASTRPFRIEIEGYADRVGELPYNADLALNRARAVWQYLRSRLPIEIPVETMSLVSYGEGQARGEGPNPLDRRVVVKVWGYP